MLELAFTQHRRLWPDKDNFVSHNFILKIQKIICQKLKLFKIGWNGEKIGRKWFLDFLAPPKKISKLPGMARTFIKSDFQFFDPPPPKEIWWAYKFFFSKMKKSKLFKITWNGEKISQKRVLDFLAPPPKKKYLEGVQKIFFKNEENQSFSKLPEMARKLVENEFWTF